MNKRVKVGGVFIDCVSRATLAAMMVSDRDAQLTKPKLVFSANGQSVSMAASDPEFARDYRAAEICHADGMSAVFASRLFTRSPLPERISTTDFFHDAARSAERHGLSFYFLGGTAETVTAAYRAAKRQYPGIKWVGYRDGYFGVEEEADICRAITQSGADVVWVGLGRPVQEAFCVRNRHRLKGVTWLKTCGGLFDFIAGRHIRAPRWVQALGFEWAFRLFLEPRRLMKRYATTIPHALLLFARQSGSVVDDVTR